jgi:hypothetical protein
MSTARATLHDLRRTRTKRRLGSTDWYDVAYRVYLFAFSGLVAVVVISDAVDGLIDDEVSTADLLARGPSILGLAAVLAFAVGLRSGADGGPVAVETADVRHVLLSPISRRLVLFTPIWQRFRSVMFGLGLACAVVGQLVATELVGSRAAWAASCGIYGAIVGAVFVGTGVLAHALRTPRWLATCLGAVALAWQGAVAWQIWNDAATGVQRLAPANLVGNIALWGIDQRPVDAVPIVVTVAVVAGALAAGDRLRLEPLVRRGELVSQLRFAATTQDLRTVVLLRRQLRAEALRNRPWFAGARPAAAAPTSVSGVRRTNAATTHRPKPSIVWRRGLRSLRRLPASRLARIAMLGVAAGAFGSLTVTSSPLFALLLLASIFVLGIESIEALSQEVDRADRTDAIPIERGWIFANHLVAPAVLLAGVAVLSAATAAVLDPSHAVAATALAIPVLWGGALGPVIATVNDAPPSATAEATTIMGAPRNPETSLVPPEFAGFTTIASTLLPVLISCIGVLPVIVLRFDETAATASRATVGTALAIGLTVLWVRRRDSWSTKIRAFFAEGRAAA